MGKTHLHVDNTTEDDEEWSEDPIFQGVVAEDADFVYAGSGALESYDDEGCAGEFDVEVHVVPKAERPALVAKLVSALRKRATDAEAARDVPRTLYKRVSINPFSQRPQDAYFTEAGVAVFRPRNTDIIVDETRAAKAPAKKAPAKKAPAKKR